MAASFPDQQPNLYGHVGNRRGITLAVVAGTERIMPERFSGRRYGYLDTWEGLIQRLGSLNSVDEVSTVTVQTVHEQMRVKRVLILLQDPLFGD